MANKKISELPSASTPTGAEIIELLQSGINKQFTYLANTAVALVDASSMALTAPKHTLTTSSATRTFTISYTGDDISLRVILNATSSTFTFPAGALCISEGVATGDNTCPLAGVSGDKYVITIKHWGSAEYTVVCKNEGQ